VTAGCRKPGRSRSAAAFWPAGGAPAAIERTADEQQATEHRGLLWDNFGWGELGCYGGGVLRGAPAPRIDQLADQGLKLLNFNVEAQCTPSRSAILTGRHPIRSGALLCFQGNRLQAIKWRQWKAHLFSQDDFYSNWTPLNEPALFNLEWDPREEHQVGFPHIWVAHPMAAAAAAFMKSLVMEPPIKPGAPDPYTPPKPGDLVPQEHLQLGAITQFVTTLHTPTAGLPQT
jgi:Sulfatase